MALYHSARGSVDYTIVGSPTIVDGVASGFSSSDYIYLPSKDILANDVFDFVFKFKLNSINKYYVLLGMAMTTPGGSAAYNGLRIQGNTNKLTFGRALGGAGNVEGPNIALNANVDYWARVLQDENNIRVGLSTNGIDYAYGNAYPKEDMLQTMLYRWVIGGAVNLNSFVDGSIDLNHTYITVNGQPLFGICPIEVKKHQIMGPVGYTVVGTPTITDGVASGFTTSNYLKTPEFSPGSSPWEIVTSFTLGTLTTGNGILTGLGTTNSVASLVIPYSAPKTIVSYLSSNGTFWNIANGVTILSNLQENTKYVLKIEFTGTAYNWYLKQNNSWELINTIASSTPIYGNVPLLYGNNRATNYPFNGSVDLNSTYIKINRKLWFWQPRETERIVVNGVEVWTKPQES